MDKEEIVADRNYLAARSSQAKVVYSAAISYLHGTATFLSGRMFEESIVQKK